MASIKAVIRKDKIDDKDKCKIFVRVSHARKTRYIVTPWVIESKYMGSDGIIKPSHPSAASLNLAIMNLLGKYSKIIIEIGDRVDSMGMEELLKRFRDDTGGDFIAYATSRSAKLRKVGRVSMAESYGYTISHLKMYAKKDDLPFREITHSFLEGFESYLRKGGCRINTVGIYMRNIRALFNAAIDDELIKLNMYPFRKYRIRQEATIKRSLSIIDLRRLWLYRYECADVAGRHAWAIDIFMLSLFLVGINLKDLLYLERDNLINDRVYYNRAKTSKQYSINVVKEAAEILGRYGGNKYLLNVIERKEAIKGKRKREDLNKDVTGYLNRYLKEVAVDVGIQEKISSYYARHSWATIASSLDISKDVISHALGHGNNTVTDVYIDFDLGKVDEANMRVISTIFERM